MGNVTQIEYDLRGRKKRLVSPDMGTWDYAVDNLGQLSSQTDGKHQTTSYVYDLLGRMTRCLEPDLDSKWYYESNSAGIMCNKGIGKLCEATSSNGYFRRYVYDNIGRVSSETAYIDAQYVTGTAYDEAGRVRTKTFPSSVASFATPLVVLYNYNAVGLLRTAPQTLPTVLVQEDKADE